MQEVNNMLSAENALLVEFMEGHLEQGLVESAQVLKHLLATGEDSLEKGQQQDLIVLQEIVRRLTEMSKWIIHNP